MRNELSRSHAVRGSRLRWIRLGPIGLAVAAVAVASIGCGPAEPAAPDLAVELRLDPSPPVVGDVGLSLRLRDATGTPLAGAKVRVEGDMNHAGMKPVFADLAETEPGSYSGTLPFTMGGDWILLVTATTRDGNTLNRQLDVPGVRSR